MAFGAVLAQIRNMVLIEGIRVALPGIGAGVAAALGLARLLATFLYGVKPQDPLVFEVGPLFMIGVELAAVWRPQLASRGDGRERRSESSWRIGRV
jgi:putative ABC transport system permease protein